MSKKHFFDCIQSQLRDMEHNALLKTETVITSPQGISIENAGEKDIINFCANNYLGLSNHPAIVAAAHAGLDRYGFGMSSVRFICGTQLPHKELEEKLADFTGTEDCILYSSCFDANGGLFETLLSAEDAVISDQLNHASIIDGIRLCKAKRYRYLNNDMANLRQQCQQAKDDGARHLLIATDGVFSMDGTFANLAGICDIADEFQALVMIDDCHATGFIGNQGRGTPEHCGVMGRIDIITGTLGKALGGASGGYICARNEIVELLRQKSRPYLFSNALAPAITTASIAAIDYIQAHPELLATIKENTQVMRQSLSALGFNIIKGEHPIIPIMFGDAELSKRVSEDLFKHSILAVNFCYPVVPKNKARIRLQVSAAHTSDHIKKTLDVFALIAEKYQIKSSSSTNQ